MPLLVSLLAYVLYSTKGWSVFISINNHDTHIETSNLSTRLWHYMVKSSFSKVIDREATKVPYTFRNVLLEKFARSLELLSHS